MSASWPSRKDGGARAARPWIAGGLIVLALALGLAARPADARVRASAVIDSGGTIKRISISDHGIVVERSGARDTSMEWSQGTFDEERRLRGRIRDRIRQRIHAHGGVLEVGDAGTGIVRIWSDALVPAGTVVDGDAVAVFGSVEVDGEVTGDVVSVFGSVTLKSGAKVGGDCVSIGGIIHQAEGVTINGESVQLGFSPWAWGLPGASILLCAIAAGWLVSMFMGWIFALLFPTVMLRVASVVERRPAASFFVGILSLPMCVVAMILLCITVIGIPIGILLPMVYALMGYAGQLVATSVLGARLIRRSLAQGLILPLLIGTLFVAFLLGSGTALMTGGGIARPASLFLSLSGVLLLLGLGTLGTGAFLLSRFGTRPQDVVWHGHVATPHPAAAPLAPAPPTL